MGSIVRRAAAAFVLGAGLVLLGFSGWRLYDLAGERALTSAPFPDRAAFESRLQLLRDGEVEAFQAGMARDPDPARTAAVLGKVSELLTPAPYRSSRVVKWQDEVFGFIDTAGKKSFEKTRSATIEYDYGDHLGRLDMTLLHTTQSGSDPWVVKALNYRVATPAQVKAARFHLDGRSGAFWAALAASFGGFLFMVVTSAAAIGLDRVRLRWLWAPLAFVGYGRFVFDTGSERLSADFLSISAFADRWQWSGSVFDPVLLSAAIPVFALLFWVFGRKPRA